MKATLAVYLTVIAGIVAGYGLYEIIYGIPFKLWAVTVIREENEVFNVNIRQVIR